MVLPSVNLVWPNKHLASLCEFVILLTRLQESVKVAPVPEQPSQDLDQTARLERYIHDARHRVADLDLSSKPEVSGRSSRWEPAPR